MNYGPDLRELSAADPTTGCWIWMGAVQSQGYGVCQGELAHRLAFRLANGHEAKGLVCHHCDVKPCVNPAHLYDGTKSSNQKDAIRRGQSKKPPRAPAKVTDELLQKAGMLMASGSSLSAAARTIGVTYQTLQIPRHRATLNKYINWWRG